jgi:hypothetical protein
MTASSMWARAVPVAAAAVSMAGATVAVPGAVGESDVEEEVGERADVADEPGVFVCVDAGGVAVRLGVLVAVAADVGLGVNVRDGVGLGPGVFVKEGVRVWLGVRV